MKDDLLKCQVCGKTRFDSDTGTCFHGHKQPFTPLQERISCSKRRIYFVGAHRVGKSTLARWVRDTYGVKMVSEMARLELAEREAKLATLRVDVKATTDYQRSVFERQIYVESQIPEEERLVADRSFDNLAYMIQFGTGYSDLTRAPVVQSYLSSVRRRGLIFFVRPHHALLKTDDVNESVDWELVLRIDQTVKVLLTQLEFDYVPVESPEQLERQQHIRTVLSLVGWTPIGRGASLNGGG